MKKTKRRIISLITAVIMIAAMMPVMAVPVAAATPQVYYRTHVQNIGWQGTVKNGQTAGTSGKSYRLEAIQIAVDTGSYSGGVVYQTHVQNIGWQDPVADGDVSGTSGRALRLEAIAIALYGTISNYYDIWYRVHSQQFGWLGWAKNGQSAGTASYSYRLEAIQIVLRPKNSAAPGSTKNAFLGNSYNFSQLGKGMGSAVRSNLDSSYFVSTTKSGYSYAYKGQTINGGITVAWTNTSSKIREFFHSVNARGRVFSIVPGATKTAKANTLLSNAGYKRSSGNTWTKGSAKVVLTIKNGYVYGFDAYYSWNK